MIDGERRGPLELSQLVEAGVRPDTYVWCKEMDDWEQARYVADICRLYRQRIFSLNHPEVLAAPVTEEEAGRQETGETPARLYSPRGLPHVDDNPDTSVPPTSMMLVSFLLTLFCFPFTGIMAIYYSLKTRQAWEQATRSNSKGEGKLYSDKEREELRIVAHDYSRMAKMWAGITFFLGIIFYAFLGRQAF